MTVNKSIRVKRPIEAAFRLFTAEIHRWWPLKEGFSFDRARADLIFLEPRTGGRFYERFTDGAEHDVGVVTACEPPHRIVFTFKSPDWDGPTEVEVRFAPEGDATRVDLEHRGWERAGAEAKTWRDRFEGGWQTVLARYVQQADGNGGK